MQAHGEKAIAKNEQTESRATLNWRILQKSR